MEDVLKELKNPPKWLQTASTRLFEVGELHDRDIELFAELCIQEAEKKQTAPFEKSSQTPKVNAEFKELQLISIGDVFGINTLAPKKPLNFTNSKLIIVYGNNGSGKSGYVRILKHICGAKAPGNLHHNVFGDPPESQGCQISFKIDDKIISQNWELKCGTIDELKYVDIFDTSCGQCYLKNDNDVTYEPPSLSFISDLIKICEKVSKIIEEKTAKLRSIKSILPSQYSILEDGKWYNQLSFKTSNEEVERICSFDEDNAKELQNITIRLNEPDPLEKSKQLNKQISHLQNLINLAQKHIFQLSDESFEKLKKLKCDVFSTKLLSSKAAESLFKNAALEGIGTDEWQLLWQCARNFSEKVSYKDQIFPVIDDNARCVLCHQLLDSDSKKRLISFEEYIKDELQSKVAMLEKELQIYINKLDEIPNESLLTQIIDAAGIESESIVNSIIVMFAKLRDRRESFLSSEDGQKILQLPTDNSWLETITSLIDEKAINAKKFEEDSQNSNRKELELRFLELKIKEWLSQQKASILNEIEIACKLDILHKAKKLTETTQLSRLKGNLAETLITEEFVKRFREELELLGATNIKIDLVKQGTNKGKVLHRLILNSCIKAPIDEILSEGELRIISLAAFLADVTGKGLKAPFVFDDPISSLDQDFEEAVVNRLIKLSKGRQVIVFTHRLSLLGLIQEFCDKLEQKPSVTFVSKEPWGTGEPGKIPLWAQKPDKAINTLLNERLPEANKIFSESGRQQYGIYSQSICSEFRKLLEKTVESELLSDVIQRYRRDIQTKGKIHLLSKVRKEDTNFLDKLITKYSRYEHSQPLEAPVKLPDPEEIKKDLLALGEWVKDFTNRKRQMELDLQ